MMHAPLPHDRSRSSTEEFVRTAADALHHTEHLVRAELALAKTELYQELRVTAGAVAAIGAGFLLFQGAFLVWAAALVLWLGLSGWVAALIALGFAVLAGVSTVTGVMLLKRRHLSRTRNRLQLDAQTIKESTNG